MKHIIVKFGKLALWGGMIWAIGLTLFFVSIFMSRPQTPHKTTDAIVVLTGGAWRIETGLGLFAAGKAPELFISGVHPDVKLHQITSKWKGDTTLPPCCITLGYDARTTTQNAQETRHWLTKEGYHSLRLVTGNFHMSRALIDLKHALPGIEIIPHPISQPDAQPHHLWFWVISTIEYHKTLIRWGALIFASRPDMPDYESSSSDNVSEGEHNHE